MERNTWSTIESVLANMSFWGVLIAATLVVTLGYAFQKRKLIFDNWEKVIVKIIIFTALPALVMKSFLVDLTKDGLFTNLMLMLMGMLFYLLLTLTSHLFFLKTSKNKRDIMTTCVAFSSTVYFGTPLVNSLYPESVVEISTYSSLFLVGFWIFMCSAGLQIVKRKNNKDSQEHKISFKEKAKNYLPLLKNPIIIASLLGFALWISQLIPGLNFIKINNEKVYLTRVDQWIPGVKELLAALAPLASPLAWFSIGCVLAKGNIIEASKNKLVWWGLVVKSTFTPAILIIVFVIFAAIGKSTGGYNINTLALVLCVTMIAAPTANTIVGYAIAYQKEELLASQMATITILTSVITMPLWVLISTTLGNTSLFT